MISIRTIKRVVRRNINLSVPWYLMACYAYYVDDDPLMDDAAFEYLARYIDRHWWEIKHRHKWEIDRDNVVSGHNIEYPSIVRHALADVRGY